MINKLKNITKKTVKKTDKKTGKKQEKLTPKHIELKGFLSFFILHELNSKKLSGDELSSEIGARKGSILTPGTIYPALKRLRRQKLVKYQRDGRKKIYYLTPEGKLELKALYIAFKELFFGFKNRLKR